MKCPNCAYENADSHKFCEQCGTRLPAADAVTAPQTVPGSGNAGRSEDVRPLRENVQKKAEPGFPGPGPASAAPAGNARQMPGPQAQPYRNAPGQPGFPPQGQPYHGPVQGAPYGQYAPGAAPQQGGMPPYSAQPNPYAPKPGPAPSGYPPYGAPGSAPMYAAPAGTRVQTAPGKPPKKKGRVILIVVIALVALLAIGGAVFIGSNYIISSISPDPITDEQLLALARENQDRIVDIYGDVPFTSAKVLDSKAMKVGRSTTYEVEGEMVRENDKLKVEGRYDFNLRWDGPEKKWELIFGGASENLKVTPKSSVSDEDVKEALDYLSITSDKDKTWHVSQDTLVSSEIVNRETKPDGSSEIITVKLKLADKTKELDAEIKMEFTWMFDSWFHEYDNDQVVYAKEKAKAGAEFTFDANTVYSIWAGESINLRPDATDGVKAQITIPKEAKKVISGVKIAQIRDGLEDGSYIVEYTFDVALGNWFKGTMSAEEAFTYDEKDKVYYLDDHYAFYNFKCTEANIAGVWNGTYKTADKQVYKLSVELKPIPNSADSYNAVVTVSSDKKDFKGGSYQATAEMNKDTMSFSLTAGSWIKESNAFYRFTFGGILNPDQLTIKNLSGEELDLARQK